MARRRQRPLRTKKIKLRSNDEFIKAVNDGIITLEYFSEQYMEGWRDGEAEKMERLQYILFTAALRAARDKLGIDDRGLYSLFEGMNEEVNQNLVGVEKCAAAWEEMRETLQKVMDDIPDPDMMKDEMPDGKFYYEE